MKMVKLGVAAILAVIGVSGSSFTNANHKAFAVSYFWYSVQAGSNATGVFKTKNPLATEAGSLYTINAIPGHARFRYGFVKTITNNPTISRTYTLYVK